MKTLMCKTELLLELINRNDQIPVKNVMITGAMMHSTKGELKIGITGEVPPRLVVIHDGSGRAAMVHITKLLESMAGELFKSSLL
jgi:hypothetical protein